jgi:hypothetical protein
MLRNMTCSVVLASLYVLGLAPNAQARHHRDCSNASLKGPYAFYTTGIVLPAGTHRENLAVLTFDGEGNYVSNFTTNDNGTVTEGTIVGNTYKVNPNCTASSFDTQGQEIAKMVLIDGGREFFMVRTNPANLVIRGVGKKQFSDDDEKEQRSGEPSDTRF